LRDEVEITVIATGFEAKEDTNVQRTPRFEDNGANYSAYDPNKITNYLRQNMERAQQQEVVEETSIKQDDIPTSRVQVEDNDDIPTFLKKIRGDF